MEVNCGSETAVARQPRCLQYAGRGLAGSGDIADVLYQPRIAIGRVRNASLDRVDDRSRREIPDQNVSRTLVHVTSGGADLVVRVRRDVLHEEVQNPGVPLQHSQKLQRSIRGRKHGRGRFGRGFRGGRRFRDEPQLRDEIFRQFAAE